MDVSRIIEAALQEDIGSGDITTDSLIPAEAAGRGEIVAKEPLVLAGLKVACRVFAFLDPDVIFPVCLADGEAVDAGATVLAMSGRLAALLKGERTALNFLQRLSGIATLTRDWLQELGDSPVKLVDTRKTTPGLRALEKYAVRAGGGSNHRLGLFDGVLIKDNHIAVCGGITEAVTRVRERAHHLLKIEVEVADLEQAAEAVDAGADIIMLDNMDPETIRAAVSRIGGRARVEVSGTVTREKLKMLAATGVDFISAGALTHSARAVDLSMRIADEN